MAELFADPEFFDDDEPNDGFIAQENVAVDKTVERDSVQFFGHAEIESRLVKMFNENKLPHAMLFVGPRGVGKGTLAQKLAIARLAHVDNPVDEGPGLFGGDPTNEIKIQKLNIYEQHPVAKKILNGAHPDFTRLTLASPDGEGGKTRQIIPVDDVRGITKFLRMTANTTNGWRVAIIDPADRMNMNAQNALLKILEEPPKRTLIILVAHQMGTLLPTIRSRVQLVSFHALSDNDFQSAVRSMGRGVQGRDTQWLAALSHNCPGQAHEILDNDYLDIVRTFAELWAEWPKYNEQRWQEFAERMGGQGADDGAYRFLTELWQWFIGALVEAKVDVGARTRLASLIPHDGLARLLDRLPLNTLLLAQDQTTEHFQKTIGLALERRQALYAARMLLTEDA